jgi:heme-degrading monooxygenase HmoA
LRAEPGVVEEMVMIARMWRGWVRTEQANAYVAYITGTGLREYAATPGNRGCQMWTRDLGDGRTEVLTVSWWESRTAIVGFAGPDIEAAVFYPDDDEYLVDRETTVSHFEVAAARPVDDPPRL